MGLGTGLVETESRPKGALSLELRDAGLALQLLGAVEAPPGLEALLQLIGVPGHLTQVSLGLLSLGPRLDEPARRLLLEHPGSVHLLEGELATSRPIETWVARYVTPMSDSLTAAPNT